MVKAKEPYKPHNVTEMLMYLQAHMTVCRRAMVPINRSIHRAVGCAGDLAAVLEEVLPDLAPDLQTKAEKALNFYRETVRENS